MRLIATTILLLTIAGPALSGEIPAPIREVMEVTTVFWSPKEPKLGSIFSEDRLKRLYSADFVRLYRAAMKHPSYKDGDTPFDFDVIVQAQDSCTPESIDMHLFETKGATREYEISFARLGCFDGGAPTERSTIYIDIVKQGGQDDIDDIVTYEANGKTDSTKVLMANIAENQPDRLYEPPR